MPTPINTNGITGTDGIVPVYDGNARWCWWNMDEIFDGTIGAKRYVPKVNDYVEDTIDFITYIVTSIDPVTLIPTMVPINRSITNGVITDNDALIGPGPESYRLYYDTTVTPHVLAVDIRTHVKGTQASYAKIFKGHIVTGAAAKVISFMYDSGGAFLSQNIPLELVAIDSHVNHSIRTVSVCYTNEVLLDGEIATVVVYSADGHVLSKRQLLVENTSFIRTLNASQKYVSNISLKSPFLSSTDSNTLEYPINVPMQSFNMIGVVNYSDGSKLEIPVDGSRFKILGLERYIATVVGQRLKLVLSYALGETETAYGAVSGDSKYVTEPFDLITINQVGSFSVKLYCYPVWVDATTGYVLKWSLYNLERMVSFDVTPYVNYNPGSPVFNGLSYGVNQSLSVRVNLRDISPVFTSFIHVQNIQVLLREPGTARQTNWSIIFEPGQPAPYGVDTYAKVDLLNASTTRIYLNSGAQTQTDWMNKLFFNTKPLYDNRRESAAPTPNYFAIMSGSERYEFPVAAWNNPFTVPVGLTINDTLFVEFFKRDANGDILLGRSGLPIYEN